MVVRGEPFPIFPLAAYLQRLGAHLDKIREVHLHGGQRTAIVPGDELRRVKDKLFFAFTRADSGHPRMEWPSERVEANTKIDLIRVISIYEEKDPPRFDQKRRALHFADGKPIEGVPYAEPEETRRGIRVYLDGRLATVIRRKNVPASVPIAAPERLQLGPLLGAMGVSLDGVQRAALLDDDREVLTLDAAQVKDAATLRLLEKKGGAGEIQLSADAEAMRVTAIVLLSTPPAPSAPPAPKGSQ